MKIEINLDDLWLDDYGGTVGNIIKQEIETQIRATVKAEMKSHREQIANEVAKVAKEALKKLRSDSVRAAASKLIETL